MPLFVRTAKTRSQQRRSACAAIPPLLLTLLVTATLTVLAAANVHSAELVVVVDDVGYHLDRARRLVALPGRITLGMLPFAPHTPEIARHAARHDKEIILHQPMEPMPSPHARAERGTLTLAMSAERFDQQFERALANVPHAVGVNNHTGSLLTQHPAPMHRLMGNIQRRGLFFLDSRTTPRTVAASTAQAWRVPTASRDVFLDHERSPRAIDRAFAKALGVARRKGHAVVIAHPYRMTLDFLEHALASLPEDVRLASLSDILSRDREIFRRRDRTTLALLGSPASPNISPAR